MMINRAEWASEYGQITKLRLQTRALHDLRCENGVSLDGEGSFLRQFIPDLHWHFFRAWLVPSKAIALPREVVDDIHSLLPRGRNDEGRFSSA